MCGPLIKIEITAMCNIVSKWGRKEDVNKDGYGTVNVRFLIDSLS